MCRCKSAVINDFIRTESGDRLIINAGSDTYGHLMSSYCPECGTVELTVDTKESDFYTQKMKREDQNGTIIRTINGCYNCGNETCYTRLNSNENHDAPPCTGWQSKKD
jgi:phage FluMu protein Com